MLSIRLSRKGKPKMPTYRLIVVQKTKDPWGRNIEDLGHYNPRSKELVLQADRVKYWLGQGAQATATVWNLLVTKGLVEGKKKAVSTISKRRQDKKAAKDKASEAANPVAPAAEIPKVEEIPAPVKEAPVAETPAPVKEAPVVETPPEVPVAETSSEAPVAETPSEPPAPEKAEAVKETPAPAVEISAETPAPETEAPVETPVEPKAE